MKSFSFTFYCVIFCLYEGLAQRPASGGISLGMANSSAALATSGSLWDNPALLDERPSEVMFGLIRYLPVEGFQTVGGLGHLKAKHFSLGLGFQHFGDKSYNENLLGIGLGRQKGRFSMGFRLTYQQTTIPEFENQRVVTGSLGFNIDWSSRFSTAIVAENVTQNAKFEAIYPKGNLKVGVALKPIEVLTLTLQEEFFPNYPFTFSAGLNYAIKEKIWIQTGVRPSVRSLYFGAAYVGSVWSFLVGCATISGLNPQFNIVKTFKSEKR